MDGTCKEWWYKDKMTGVSKKKYFCLFQPDILTINYRCLEDFLLIFGPSWAQNTILPKKEKREREREPTKGNECKTKQENFWIHAKK